MAGGAARSVSVRGAGGASLSCLDFGGEGPSVLLLHGLCGEAAEWGATASWLRAAWHVYALDQRGHGASDRTPGRYRRDDYVADATGVVEQLALAPVILVGQSMGGLNAYLVAARRPELVGALVVVEAQASADPDGIRSVLEWLRRLPVPFAGAEEARRFMQDAGFPGEAWRELLQERQDGWWPRFDVDGAVESAADMANCDYWSEWRAVRCRTLVVGGAASELSQAELREMARSIPDGRYERVEGAGHNLHLDRPDGWRAVLEGFLAGRLGTVGERAGA
jgi:pimeloyl-ACP methyl ester carboxylesterase